VGGLKHVEVSEISSSCDVPTEELPLKSAVYDLSEMFKCYFKSQEIAVLKAILGGV
jgi:hypothetical protein